MIEGLEGRTLMAANPLVSQAGQVTTDLAFNVAVSGNYAYVADQDLGLRVVSVANPALPSIVGSYDTPGLANAVAIVGNYAYVADGDTGLLILNVSNPAVPTLAGSYDTSGFACGVTVVGNYAYVADEEAGLTIVNISNPAAPTLAGTYNTPGIAYSVAVAGNYAYVADLDTGLQIVNVSNPASPTLAGAYDTPGYAWAVAVAGNYAYIADDEFGLQIVNISNPASPTLAGTYDTAGYASAVSVVGNYAYVADFESGVQVVDIRNPAAPVLASTYDTAGAAWGLAVSGNYVYVADDFNGLVALQLDWAPTITAVYARGSAWTASFLNYLAAQNLGDATFGFQIKGGADQLKTLPWNNVNRISVRFSEDVVVHQNDLILTGINTGTYNVAGSTFAYDAATRTASWTLPSVITRDKLRLSLNGTTAAAITDATGNAIDGDWVTSGAFPSGNGSTGGQFSFRFNVLPGDANRNNAVQASDGLLERSGLGKGTATVGYSAYVDVNGNGAIQASDGLAVRGTLGNGLPAGEPAEAVFASGLLISVANDLLG